MDAILKDIVNSPKLYIYKKEIEDILIDESRKRQDFYKKMGDEKIEFINGEIILHSPVRLSHSLCVKYILSLTDAFVRNNKLGFVGYEKLMISLTRNDYEPDICFFDRIKSDNFKPDQLHFPVPDFIVEVISGSTEHIDRCIKFEDYAAHGVSEYWIVDPDLRTIEQYLLKKDNYELYLKTMNGTIKSFAIKDFEIPVSSVFNDQENLEQLKKYFK